MDNDERGAIMDSDEILFVYTKDEKLKFNNKTKLFIDKNDIIISVDGELFRLNVKKLSKYDLSEDD